MNGPFVLQITGADKNRPIRLRVSSKIFSPRVLLDRVTVLIKNFQFVSVISLEVTVKGFPTDNAAHRSCPSLSPKHDDTPIENVSRVRFWKC